jgi:4-hydroxy-3-methylbut-2-enyl diphosphate reductase
MGQAEIGFHGYGPYSVQKAPAFVGRRRGTWWQSERPYPARILILKSVFPRCLEGTRNLLMEVLLIRPRGFCAGVVRAVQIVEAALEIFDAPVYVFHEIVHNQRVVERLRARGAVFVEDLDEIPPGTATIFSAHGVSLAIVEEARRKNLRVIDATCPLVAKVHLEAARHARAGREVVLIGHAGHDEIVGTLGNYNCRSGGGIYLVQKAEDVAALEVKDPDNLAYLTQTTLSVDDTKQIIAALQARFPKIQGPSKDDICYATQNRQNAVGLSAQGIDLLLVVGSRNSSNSNRLREVGEGKGLASFLVQDATEIKGAWLAGVRRIGITAGASTPEELVQEVIARLRQFGANRIVEAQAPIETMRFALPPDPLSNERLVKRNLLAAFPSD